MIKRKDFSVAWHSLGKNPGYLATVVLTLGLTLGALVAMFNLNFQLLAAPLPYPDQDRLHVMQCNAYKNGQLESLGVANVTPYPVLEEGYRKGGDMVENRALVNFYVDAIRDLPDTPQVNTTYITPEYLEMLQPPMALGRTFNKDEGFQARVPVAVISHKTWEQQFNRDPNIIGKAMRFGEVDFKIVGVTSEDFVEPQIVEIGRTTQVWLPWDYNQVPENFRSWGGFVDHEYLIVKLAENASRADAERQLTGLLNGRFKEENAAIPYFDNFTLGFELFSFHRVILGDSKAKALLMLAGALVLLLIAATNITNLIMARAASQQRNMAIQAALGAQKSHLFAGVLAEILITMGLAVVVALLVAGGGVALLKQVAAGHLPRLAELHLSVPSLAFALASALLLALIFAALVSHQVNYRALNTMLQSSGKGVGLQISARVRQVLILVQVALAGVLLAVNIQILQTSWTHITQPLGLTVDDLYEVELNVGQQRQATAEERKRNLIAIRDELRGNAKVEGAFLTHYFPIGQNSAGADYGGVANDPEFREQQRALMTNADEGYLQAYDMKLIAGRYFEAGEFQQDTHVMVINETLARRLQTDGQVLGKRYYAGFGDPYEVVGIIRDLSLPGVPEEPRFFMPHTNVEFPRLLIKFKPNQSFTKEELNGLMAKVNSQYKASVLMSMDEARSQLLARDRLSAWLTAALALLTLCLAAIGIYGVLSYSVLLRRAELGIRMAIGARPVTVFTQILRDNLLPLGAGLVIALALLLGIWFWLQRTSYELPIGATAWLLPLVLILALGVAASLLAVWKIISRPALYALRNE